MLMLTCYLFIQPNILYGIPRINHAKQDKIQKNVLKEKEIRNTINNKANIENNPSYADELIPKDDIVLQGNETPVYNDIKQDKDFNYLKEYAPLVESFFKNNQPYLNKGYSISQLSEDTDIPVHHLSALFNKVYGIRFNDYLNSYRLQYLEVNLSNPDFKDFSQEGLAWQAGFNSRISFFNAVKKLREVSPAEFLQKEK
jgi:AraC-like DNA-binding protein